MNYKLMVLLSSMAYSHNYVVKLNIDNTTSSDFTCYYTSLNTMKKEKITCKTGEKCQLEWQNPQPFKIELRRIRCGGQKCYLHSQPVTQQTLHAVHKNHVTYQNSIFKIVQSWPFNEYIIRPLH